MVGRFSRLRCQAIVVGLLLLCSFAGPSVVASGAPGDSTDRPWSLRMAESFIGEHPHSIAYPDDPRSDKWMYEQGVVLEALRQVWAETGETKYFDYIRKNIDRFVDERGRIQSYDYGTFNLDNIPTGRQLLMLYRRTGDLRYRHAADTLRKQLRNQPRTPSGGFWHKQIYPNQMWLDGLYMAEPFYAEYARMFGDSAAWDDIVHQFSLVEQHTRDTATGLLFHAWDESRTQRWADPVTGRSPHFWGRAMGWYAMALADLLDFFPAEHPRRTELLEIFRRLAAAVTRFRDSSSGLWYQVVDRGTERGNYLESSASCMFVYSLAKGARRGYLDRKYFAIARESYRGILKTFVTVDSTGAVHIHQACAGAGLGGSPYRDGSFAYYVGERRRSDDFKAIGPFIMASLELEKGGPGERSWRSSLDQPEEWYATAEAVRIAENVLLYQCRNGGWPKNIDMALRLSPAERRAVIEQKDHAASTIDNGATHTQMRYLGRVFLATRDPRFSDAFCRGLDFLLEAQYPNGGWPQYFPLRPGYYSNITFNDSAMAGVLNLLLDISRDPSAYPFVDESKRSAVTASVSRGVDCILQCQIRVNDRPTVWCAQHDPVTYAPARGRVYELPSLSGEESVGIVRFLMRLPNPSPEVIRSIGSAVRWLDGARITGVRLVTAPGGPYGADRVLVNDSTAPPLWARFYDLQAERPLYCDRDGVPRKNLGEISWERRNHYGWLGTWPARLVSVEYPAWLALRSSDPDSLAGRGRIVGLDGYYNCEWKRGKDSLLVRYHYTWEDTANSGFSIVGKLIRKSGAEIARIDSAPTPRTLTKISVYVIVDPDTPAETPSPHTIESPAADAIERWVRDGGVLVLLGNDRGNAEFEHLNALAGRFGIRFNEDSEHRVTGGRFADGTCDSLPPHPIFFGVGRIYLKEVSTLTLSGPARPVLVERGKVLMASAVCGNGLVFAVGDPWLYNEYIDGRKLPPGYDNALAGANLFRWLLLSSRRVGHGQSGI